jgi:uncharacterized RDD family membrane protein YckC
LKNKTEILNKSIQDFRYQHLLRRFFAFFIDTVALLLTHKILIFFIFDYVFKSAISSSSENFLSSVTTSFYINAFSLPFMVATYYAFTFYFFSNQTIGMKFINLKVVNINNLDDIHNRHKLNPVNVIFRSLSQMIYLGPLIYVNIYSSLNGIKINQSIAEILSSSTYILFFVGSIIFATSSMFLCVLRKDQNSLADLSSSSIIVDEEILNNFHQEHIVPESKNNTINLREKVNSKEEKKAA